MNFRESQQDEVEPSYGPFCQAFKSVATRNKEHLRINEGFPVSWLFNG